MNNYKSGIIAELMARIYLRFKGYRILKSNFVTGKGTHAGEVDFIANKSNLLVFVEVKKRTDIESAAYAISERQKARTRRGAEAFLKQNPKYQNFDIRFDAILVQFPFHVVHLIDAF